MKCSEIRRKLAEYVAGDLPPAAEETIKAHLLQCAGCRAEAAALEQCELALGVLGEVEEAPDLREDLRRRIAAPVSRRPRWAAMAVVGGVGLVVGVAMALMWPRGKVSDVAPVAPPPVVVQAPTPVESELPRPRDADMMPSRAAPVRPEPRLAKAAKTTGPPPEQEPLPRPLEVVSEPVENTTREGEATPGESEPTTRKRAPVVAVLATGPDQTPGVLLLVGEPEPAQPVGSCYVEVSRPGGVRSVFETTVRPGAPRVIRMSCEQIASRPHDEGG